jgi:hypothetical protein
MAFKKIDKEYKLSDDTVNCYGFRMLTAGYKKEEYLKNPIGYHMHDRPSGVLVRWEDLTIKDDGIYGKPVINMSHPRGAQTVAEIEDGFLNAASVGHIVALEFSTDPADQLAGQTGPTITSWYNRECSLVDIPGNFNALTKLYDKDENEINLADLATTLNPKTMSKIIFTAAMLSAISLSDNASDIEVEKAFKDLVAKAASADKLKADLQNLNDKVCKDRVSDLLAKAEEGKKITKELSAKLASDYATNPEGLESLLSAIPAYTPISQKLETGSDKSFGANLVGKSWTELQELGVLEDLKSKNIELFKEAYKTEFNREYVG